MKKTHLLIFALFIIMLLLLSTALFHQSNQSILFPFFPTPTPVSQAPGVFQKNPVRVVSSNISLNEKDVPVNTKIVFTFNKAVSKSEVYFSLEPNVPYTTEQQTNTFIIIPTSPLQQSTTYTYLVYPRANQAGGQSNSFTTEGSQTPTPMDTRPQNIEQDENGFLLKNHPDVFLSNNVPYQTSQFSIDDGFDTDGAGHFYFTVAPEGDMTAAKQGLFLWLESLGLSNAQIQQLDIRYQ